MALKYNIQYIMGITPLRWKSRNISDLSRSSILKTIMSDVIQATLIQTADCLVRIDKYFHAFHSFAFGSKI